MPIPFDSWPCGCVGACDGPAECALAPRERELEAITSSGFDGCHGGPRRVDNLSSVDCCCFICDNLSSYTFFPPFFISFAQTAGEKAHTCFSSTACSFNRSSCLGKVSSSSASLRLSLLSPTALARVARSLVAAAISSFSWSTCASRSRTMLVMTALMAASILWRSCWRAAAGRASWAWRWRRRGVCSSRYADMAVTVHKACDCLCGKR